MSLVSLRTSVISQKNLLTPIFNGILLQSRNAWGNVNLPTKRGENRPNRHWNARHSKMRVAKEMKLKLPDVEKERKMSAEKDVANQREEMKKRGILPVGPSSEYPVYMGCSPSVFDAFIPVRSDGIATQIKDITKKKGKSFRAVNKIRKYDHDFDVRNFPQEAEEVYIKAHTALANRRFKELHNYATELCYPKMVHNATRMTLYWEYIKALEPPSVSHVRTEEILVEDNLFAQVTVKMLSQQILAVYDRFGRLIHGHPYVAKDVEEYVVFEKHVNSMYAQWRVHDKIIPDWLAAKREPGTLTARKEIIPEVVEDKETSKADSDEEDEDSDDEDSDDEDKKKVDQKKK